MTDSTTRVPPTKITGVYGGLLKIAMRKMLGEVPESAVVMWHHPDAFKDMMKFGSRTEKWDRLERNLATLAIMAAAATVGSSSCLDLHYFMSRDKGLAGTKAREVPRWRESEIFLPLE